MSPSGRGPLAGFPQKMLPHGFDMNAVSGGRSRGRGKLLRDCAATRSAPACACSSLSLGLLTARRERRGSWRQRNSGDWQSKHPACSRGFPPAQSSNRSLQPVSQWLRGWNSPWCTSDGQACLHCRKRISTAGAGRRIRILERDSSLSEENHSS